MIKVEQIIALINEQRQKVGAAALSYRSDLTQSANLRAQEASIFWSHSRPNGTPYYTVDDRIYGENLAKNYFTAEQIVNAWMNSKSHKDNMLNSKYKGACIGEYRQGNRVFYALEFTL